MEMADSMEELGGDDPGGATAANGAQGEAHGALLALGYKPAEVTRLLAKLDTAQLGAEELIREALKRAHTG